ELPPGPGVPDRERQEAVPADQSAVEVEDGQGPWGQFTCSTHSRGPTANNSAPAPSASGPPPADLTWVGSPSRLFTQASAVWVRSRRRTAAARDKTAATGTSSQYS